jgi:hypothetical protein
MGPSKLDDPNLVLKPMVWVSPMTKETSTKTLWNLPVHVTSPWLESAGIFYRHHVEFVKSLSG